MTAAHPNVLRAGAFVWKPSGAALALRGRGRRLIGSRRECWNRKRGQSWEGASGREDVGNPPVHRSREEVSEAQGRVGGWKEEVKEQRRRVGCRKKRM